MDLCRKRCSRTGGLKESCGLARSQLVAWPDVQAAMKGGADKHPSLLGLSAYVPCQSAGTKLQHRQGPCMTCTLQPCVDQQPQQGWQPSSSRMCPVGVLCQKQQTPSLSALVLISVQLVIKKRLCWCAGVPLPADSGSQTSCRHHAPLVRPSFGASKVFVYYGEAGKHVVTEWPI
jgi:hypothetical protein